MAGNRMSSMVISDRGCIRFGGTGSFPANCWFFTGYAGS
ncbi:hypothetical protein TREPR_1673 [Treponema primitia ZAS-2]|uniref:Uncharacterized protein n=1 Tax=Treponema primitia (strain ATCC BAA-887 / DSM 12427 / ZAS-2) TaxID=545694 RepID=F5YMZ4_TREPZ|nr:hypothetical protein TREPR_1673 [Treponema primitia ZAS-2]